MTRDDIEKAFADQVEYRLCTWRDETGLRRPTMSEVKQRLLALANTPPSTRLVGSGPEFIPKALNVIASRGSACPSVVSDEGEAVVGLDVISEHPSKNGNTNEADDQNCLRNVHGTAPLHPIPLHVRNFLGKVQGACLGIAMSGADHPNPDEVLMDLFREAQEILFPHATATRDATDA